MGTKAPVPKMFDTFLDAPTLLSLIDRNGPWIFDFNTTLGDTIKEKYDALQPLITSESHEIVRKGGKGHFWLVTSPELESVIEVGTRHFAPITCEEYMAHIPLGMSSVMYRGILRSHWRVYTCTDFKNEILIGYGDTLNEHRAHYRTIIVANFLL